MLYYFGGDFLIVLVALIVIGVIGMMPDIIEGILVALFAGSFLYFFCFNIYLFVRYAKRLHSNKTLSAKKIGLGLLILILTLFIGYYIVAYITGMVHYVDDGLHSLLGIF